jgi:type VI secretion system FHA domain protein
MSSASFDQQGGTLGRSSENHFVLSDPEKYVSRKHAAISYENGFYYLTDTSTAGTFIPNKDLHVHRNKVQLADGDTLRIGDYDLMVSILSSDSSEPAPYSAAPQADDSSIFNFGNDMRTDGEPRVEDIIGRDEAFPEPDSDPFDFGPADQSPSPNHIRDNIEGSPHGDSFVPPEVAPPEPAQTIPQDFDIDDLLGGSAETAKPFDDAGETAEIFPDPVIPAADTPNGQSDQRAPDAKAKAPRHDGDLVPPTRHPPEPAQMSPPAAQPKAVPVSFCGRLR